MYPAKKPLRFVKNFVFLRPVTSELLHEISPFALFLVKKQVRKHAVPSKKTVNFYRYFSFERRLLSPPPPLAPPWKMRFWPPLVFAGNWERV